MSGALSISSEIAGAATALAGLILVFLGATATGFDGFQKIEQKAVRQRYQQQAWTAFIGLVFSLAATFAALLAKWNNQETWAMAAFFMLIVAVLFVIAAALKSVLEIK